MEGFLFKTFQTSEIKKEPRRRDTDADAGTGADADTLTRQKNMGTAVAYLNKPFCSLSAQSSTPSVATAAASSCAGSRVPTSQSDTESVASPTAALKQDLEGVEAQLRGLADRRARVEAEPLRFTCEETFLRRQQRRLLHGIIVTGHGEDAHTVECSAEVAPTGLHVSRSRNLVSGWIDKLIRVVTR